ncbi:hypothetical protein [Bacillus sp. S14(2024)]|uniref:hypothetical protein n=1 Tax=Bacillus sp. S14(2024) TaxID=3162884 RepID=UPI003D233574
MRILFLSFLFPLILLSHTNATFAETESNQLESQISSFMSGLQTKTPKQAIELWILGVKNRSGAVQFAMLSPSLQQQTQKKFEQSSWVTGQSSPWVDNFRFVKVDKISNTKWKFTIAYDLITSFAKIEKGQKIITVEKNSDPGSTNWFITKITSKYNPSEAFTPAETII